MANAKVAWTPGKVLDQTVVTGDVDGVSFTYPKFRAHKAKDGEKSEPLTLGAVSTALGYKKEANAARALIEGKNKQSAKKARATAKLESLDE